MKRRNFLGLVFLAPGISGAATARSSVRIGLTPVFLNDQTFLNRWQGYLEERLGRSVEFVQRGNYREITELVLNGRVDFAWLCGYPYVRYREHMDLLTVPIYQGEPLYRSYLIVGADDARTETLEDLEGRLFAFSDPLSNSGWLVPQARLLAAGHDPEGFFARTFFAGAHRNVIEAVAVGLANGGAVDGYVYDALARLHPELTERTRIIWRSETYGFPPVVARNGVDPELRGRFRDALQGMPGSGQGRALLEQFYLDGFGDPDAELYTGIERLMRHVERG